MWKEKRGSLLVSYGLFVASCCWSQLKGIPNVWDIEMQLNFDECNATKVSLVWFGWDTHAHANTPKCSTFWSTLGFELLPSYWESTAPATPSLSLRNHGTIRPLCFTDTGTDSHWQTVSRCTDIQRNKINSSPLELWTMECLFTIK